MQKHPQTISRHTIPLFSQTSRGALNVPQEGKLSLPQVPHTSERGVAHPRGDVLLSVHPGDIRFPGEEGVASPYTSGLRRPI